MSLQIQHAYEQGLRSAEPTHFEAQKVYPPAGSLGAVRIEPPLTIPPVNTNIEFSTAVPAFSLAQHPGLSAISPEEIPREFSWSKKNSGDSSDIKKKKALIAKPGNQALCGSCWSHALYINIHRGYLC